MRVPLKQEGRLNVPIRYNMSVGKLREQLSKFPEDEKVLVCWEDPETEMHLLEIDDASMHRGTPSRDAKGRPAFTADGTGPANWVFINVSRD